jgi:tRNA pseudouridine55 synthase
MQPIMTFEEGEDFRTGQILLIDKPLEWTSFDVVNKLRYTIRKTFGFKKIKVGHAGTLDPLATGVLVLCTGRMTKQIEGLMAEEKTYQTTVRLGAFTASLDAETPVERWVDTRHLTRELVEAALAAFRGSIQQRPPVFSAKKVDGKRAYQVARAGGDIALRVVEVTVHGLELTAFERREVDGHVVCDASLEIRCSKGTYIRSIGRDLGEALGVGGTLVALRRIASGAFLEDQLWTVEEAVERITNCPPERT